MCVFDSFQNFFVLCAQKSHQKVLSYRKKTQSLPPPPIFLGKEELAEEEERDIQRPRSTRTQTRRYLRAFARNNAPTARVWTFLSSFPPSFKTPRAIARDTFLSLSIPPPTKKETKGESNPIRAQKKRKTRDSRNPTTYRLRDSLRVRFSAHGRDRDASVRDLGDRGHYYCVCVCGGTR